MTAVGIEGLFASAEQAYLAGRLDSARDDLFTVQRMVGDHPAVLHLLGLVEKKSGNLDAARRSFERAALLAPNDPELANNHANLLRDLGEEEKALRRYEVAIGAAPDFKDARYNRALLLERLGRLDEALAELEQLRTVKRPEARIESAYGSVLRKLGRLDEAAVAFDAALAADPNRLTSLHGRARVAVERGEECGSSLYRRAVELVPNDKELVIGLAEALEAEGDSEQALSLLHSAVARDATWIAGHEALARMRSEAGETQSFADHYHSSLQSHPDDPDLNRSYWEVLAHGERYPEALEALRRARSRMGPSPLITMMEASLLSTTGNAAAALALLDRETGPATEGNSYLLARGRIELQARRFDAATERLERAVLLQPECKNCWAYLDLAWRLTEDHRHEWLTRQPGLFGGVELGLTTADLDALAQTLRGIHRARSHPLGQSLRGGTQTRGRLLLRREPEIINLREALERAIGSYFEGLPAADSDHPLLRHRNSPVRIGGSWSVRLVGGGFHVNHIHPNGILSSALYIALPPALRESERRDGWLELGRPPSELDLPLEPLSIIEPKPGRLALFPSYLFHGTRPFKEGERLAVAFDVEPA